MTDCLLSRDVDVSVFCSDWRRRRMFTRVRQRLHVDDARSGRSCPSPTRCLMQLVRHGHRRRPQDADSRQPGDDVGMTESGERSSCCRCSDGSSAGGGRLTAFVEACASSSAADRCRLPRCKWWKSLCTRVYLIAINLASFVSFFSCYTLCNFCNQKLKMLPILDTNVAVGAALSLWAISYADNFVRSSAITSPAGEHQCPLASTKLN